MNQQRFKMLSPKASFPASSQVFAQESGMSEEEDEEEYSFTSAAALVCSEGGVSPMQMDVDPGAS